MIPLQGTDISTLVDVFLRSLEKRLASEPGPLMAKELVCSP